MLVFYLFFFLFINLLRADLPVHCLKSQIEGKWKIEMTNLTSNIYLPQNKCGHEAPDNPQTSHLALKVGFERANVVYITLQRDYQVNYEKTGFFQNLTVQNSNWTMVYNEGFDISVGDHNFFFFSKYEPNGKNEKGVDQHKSICSETLVGWYLNQQTQQYGCVRGYHQGNSLKEKIVQEIQQVGDIVLDILEDAGELISQEIQYLFWGSQQQADTQQVETPILAQAYNYLIFKLSYENDDQNSNLQQQTLNRDNEKKNSSYQNNNYNESQDSIIKQEINVGNHQQNDSIFNKNSNKIFMKSFLQFNELFEKSETKEKFGFAYHQKQANQINSLYKQGKVTWEAEAYDDYQDITLKQLNEMSGQPLHFEDFEQQNESHEQNEIVKNNEKDDLPKEFSWEDIISPQMPQGKCGSCYAVAASKMMEYRLQILHKMNVSLSVQHILECSSYNQGCQGGFPYLVGEIKCQILGKHVHDFHMIETSCKPYESPLMSSCEKLKCSPKGVQTIYKVKNHQYIGGGYGKCNEQEMMNEILKNGPIATSLKVDYGFRLYKKGIYQSDEKETWAIKQEPKPEWVPVTHTVLCYGWGEENGIKYWKIQNSWGEKWGEKGNFRMIRGHDSGGIESTCVSMIPYPIDLQEQPQERQKFISYYKQA